MGTGNLLSLRGGSLSKAVTACIGAVFCTLFTPAYCIASPAFSRFGCLSLPVSSWLPCLLACPNSHGVLTSASK